MIMNETKLELESRYFSMDIAAMSERFPEFKAALESCKSEDCDRPVEVSVELRDLKKAAPRVAPQIRSYNRLVHYLRNIGIDLKITSQKPTKDLWKKN